MQINLKVHSSQQMSELAEKIAPHLCAGHCVLLSGVVGAGKTHFARALISARLAALGREEDIPSPTFTLVQSYELDDVEIWHADLYRLTHLDEIYELGLEAAFDSAICLVEWPEMLSELAPKSALRIHIDVKDEDTRELRLEWTDRTWESIFNKCNLLKKDLESES